MKLKSLLLALSLSAAIYYHYSSLAGVEDYCLTGGGPQNTGTCETHEGLPSEENPREKVSVKRCNFNIGAPGQEINCSGNSLNPL